MIVNKTGEPIIITMPDNVEIASAHNKCIELADGDTRTFFYHDKGIKILETGENWKIIEQDNTKEKDDART